MPGHREPVRPRLSGKSAQRIGKLSIQVHAFETETLRSQALVTLPRIPSASASRAVRAKAAAGQTVTLRFKFPQVKLKKIKAVLAKRHQKARFLVTSRNAEGEAETQSKSVRLKP